jgi:hypothetical protein
MIAGICLLRQVGGVVYDGSLSAVLAAVCGLTLVLVVSSAAGAASARSSAGAAVITGFRVKGGPTNPTFVISGRHLGVPKPNPPGSPAGTKLCPLTVTGNAGHTYGTGFYIIAWAAQPNSTNAEQYSAGRYRPSLNELDCMGLIVGKPTPSKITFTLGAAYAEHYVSNPAPIQNGDVVEVVLGKAAYATVVHY